MTRPPCAFCALGSCTQVSPCDGRDANVRAKRVALDSARSALTDASVKRLLVARAEAEAETAVRAAREALAAALDGRS